MSNLKETFKHVRRTSMPRSLVGELWMIEQDRYRFSGCRGDGGGLFRGTGGSDAPKGVFFEGDLEVFFGPGAVVILRAVEGSV